MMKVRNAHLRAHCTMLRSKVSALSLIAAMPFLSVSVVTVATAAEPEVATNVEEIVVTGSRIVRDGYEAPTPVAVLSADELQADATTTIAESVSRMPVFSGGGLARSSSGGVSPGSAGISNLNLRGLGASRNLVLLDGARIVGASFTGGGVDVNSIPAPLVSRVDVVTGGASAAYGSDAVAGVVNFILDREFTGIKGEASAGITTYGDDEQYKVNLTLGSPFANGRGHVLFSGEHTYEAGIDGSPRPYRDAGWKIMNNPAYTATNGQPQFIVRDRVGVATGTPGGQITAGPLKGTAFGQGGTPYQFTYGPLVSGNLMQGGDWQESNYVEDAPDMAVGLRTVNAFTRVSYELSENVTVYAQGQWADNRQDSAGAAFFFLNTFDLRADNAFMPASVRAAMQANNLTSVRLGTTNIDLGKLGTDNARIFRRFVIGADGAFSAFDSDWSWDAYLQRSSNHLSVRSTNNLIRPRYDQAIDAVLQPSTGRIVCRSTLANPNDGCIPYNIFGIGVNSDAAKSYVTGTGYIFQRLSQNAASFSVNGSPFSTWAGGVSVATGFEWRKEQVTGFASALDEVNSFFAGNYHASNGEFSVAEGFLETVVPLATDTSWARSLELNGAVRATDYSLSGFVATWKLGLTYQPIDDIRFRATRSRDIRAPNTTDAFSAGRSGLIALTDPFNGGVTTVVLSRETGNPLLEPEAADTTGLGVVYQPSFLPGFGASFDYFKINIKDAISTLGRQDYVDRCYQGETALCSFISRGTDGLINGITIAPANILALSTDGWDAEISYSLPLDQISSSWLGEVTLRGSATKTLSNKNIDRTTVLDSGGQLRYTASARYELDRFAATLTARGRNADVLEPRFVVCTSGCPVSTAIAPTIDNNHVPGWLLFNLSLNYQISETRDAAEIFLVIDNVTNRWPPIHAGSRSTGFRTGADAAGMDDLGRTFRAGIRFRM